MRQGKKAAFAAVVAASLVAPDAARAAPVEGDWSVQDLILQIYQCQGAFCGRVAWVKDPKRRELDCGKMIVWGLSPSGPGTWDNGTIYDTTDGNTYRLNASLSSDGTLRARIFRGIPVFGKTEILRKVSLPPGPGC